jgi:hypothetical protein
MKETSPEKKAYKQALSALRDEYHEQLEENLKSLIAIRDNPQAGAAVRVDAIRYMNQMLGLPRTAQEKPAEPPPDPKSDVPQALTLRPELLDYLDKLTTKH